jgi:hypothetical protein
MAFVANHLPLQAGLTVLPTLSRSMQLLLSTFFVALAGYM